MFRALSLLAVLSAGLLLVLSPSAESSSPAPGPGAVIGMHIQLFRAIDAGDEAKAASFVAPGEVSFFLTDDLSGERKRLDGREDAAKYLAGWAQKYRGSPSETVIESVRSDCTSAELSYAVLEIERRLTTTEGPRVVRFLSTSLVQYREGGWKLMHWHLSPLEEE